jgi:hypothetical protein
LRLSDFAGDNFSLPGFFSTFQFDPKKSDGSEPSDFGNIADFPESSDFVIFVPSKDVSDFCVLASLRETSEFFAFVPFWEKPLLILNIPETY